MWKNVMSEGWCELHSWSVWVSEIEIGCELRGFCGYL